MLNLKNNNLVLVLIIFLYIISLYIGFYLGEDLSTGGSNWDFNQTWPVVVDFSNNVFNTITQYTRHVPLHYFVLSLIYKILDSQFYVRIFFSIFVLLLPLFLFLNLKKIYNYPKINLLLVSFCVILLPYFRSSSIWPNTHLTALIFLTIGNYFYLEASQKNKKIYCFLNLLFTAFATYSIQTYVLFFIFYLYHYFKNLSKKDFASLFIFCVILSLPGWYLLSFNDRVARITISTDFFYTIATNFSIIGFFLVMFLFNKDNLLKFKEYLLKLNKFEMLLITILFLSVIFKFNYHDMHGGGGFFYKISKFLFNNNILFYLSFLMGLVLSIICIKIDKNFLFLIILINGLNLNYAVYQKYFEPVFLVMILIFYKNFLVNNLLRDKKNVIFFNIIIILYFTLGQINGYFKLSKEILPFLN